MRPALTIATARACRSIVLGTSIGVVTNSPDMSLVAVVITEIGSTIVDTVRVLPFFGNWFLVMSILPFVLSMYSDLYMFSLNERYEKETRSLLPFAMGLLSGVILTIH